MLHVVPLEYNGIHIVHNQPSEILVNGNRSDSHLNKKILSNDDDYSFIKFVIFLTLHHTA